MFLAEMDINCSFAEERMNKLRKGIINVVGWILLIPIYIYKYGISPLTPASCRHVPTCSEYAVQAIKIHGPIKGFLLTAKRISKCHPWGTHGYDPVPPKVKQEK